MALRSPTEQNATKIIESKDIEMNLESGSTSENQTEVSFSSVAKNDLTIESTANAHTKYKATDEGSKDIEMTSESHAITEALMESLKSRDVADEPMLSTTPQPTSGDILSGAEDLPILKKSRQEAQPEVKPTGPPPRKVYRGIGSGNGSGNGTVVYDRTSYSLPVVTPEQQARYEPDFVGAADYFDLRHDDVQEMIAGTYMIVYSRPLDNNQQPYGAFETYPVDFHRNRIVVSSTGSATPVAKGKGKTKKHTGIWAEGEFDFNNYLCTFMVHHRFSDDGVQALCTMKLKLKGDSTEPSTLDQVLALGLRLTGSFPTVGFGLKHMRTTMDESETRPVYLGFKFISMNLATWDITSGEENLLRVVGIKIPPKKEVASAFILNQRVVWPIDQYYLIRMPSLQPPPTFLLRDLQRKKEKDASSETKRNSWVKKAEASGSAFVKKGESSNGGDTQMG
ncbi:hypothetical protein BKA61DRAFT_659396 [Leptodontidium sp. MPI-SDFR-AT-0119]|nr:hypothetical protein BKA61DRAFT_659396 [Leptodontidium sp. MPI-SDFR-AT-0119]